MIKSILTIMTMFVGLAAHADNSDFTPVVVPHVPQAVYAPTGFDSNDNAQIVFEGYYANSCYRKGLTYHQVDQANKVIVVEDTAHFYDQQFCQEMIIPYNKTLNLGVLDPGTYEIKFKADDGKLVQFRSLTVKKALSSMPDDHLYAHVEDALYKRADLGQNLPPTVTLVGRHHTSCVKIDRVEVNHVAGSDVIQVRPITKIEGSDCVILNPPVEFKEDVALSGYKKGRYLIHIRSLNGQSLNRIVNLK